MVLPQEIILRLSISAHNIIKLTQHVSTRTCFGTFIAWFELKNAVLWCHCVETRVERWITCCMDLRSWSFGFWFKTFDILLWILEDSHLKITIHRRFKCNVQHFVERVPHAFRFHMVHVFGVMEMALVLSFELIPIFLVRNRFFGRKVTNKRAHKP